MSKDEKGFLDRAQAEGRRYGEDSWVFIRELGQNARDAFAKRISINTRLERTQARIACADDGQGMTWQHAKNYLFRLYASSKENDAFSAGRYGVGFWSVLRFRPDNLEVHSQTKGEKWAVRLSGDLKDWKRVACRQKQAGTTIVLRRSNESSDQFVKDLEAAVIRYLAHLRSAGRKACAIEVTLNGHRIDRPFKLKSSGALSFYEGDVEGVVGFGPRPSYELYARGLPVTHGAYLEELEGKPIGMPAQNEKEGAFPVFKINGNSIDVVLSRQTVVQNRAFKRVLRTARRRFDELICRTVDRAVQRSMVRKLLDRLADFSRVFRRVPAWSRWTFFLIGMLMVGGTIGAVVAWLGEPQPASLMRLPDSGRIQGLDSRSDLAAVGQASAQLYGQDQVGPHRQVFGQSPGSKFMPAFRPQAYTGFQTGTASPPGQEPNWAIKYEPRRSLLLRMLVMDRFDDQKGMQVSKPDLDWKTPLKTKSDRQPVTITIEHDGSPGKWLLPLPSGYYPISGSARLAGRPLAIKINSQHLLQVEVPRGLNKAVTIDYQVIAQAEKVRLPSGPVSKKALPVSFARQLDRIAEMNPEVRIKKTVALVNSVVGYDRSHAAANAFATNTSPEWVRKVLEIGRGDCDVINGLLVIALRQIDIPARLVLGMVGKNGRALEGTHAWVEIDKAGLQIVDASLSADSSPGFQHSSETVRGPLALQRPGNTRGSRQAETKLGHGNDLQDFLGLLIVTGWIAIIAVLISVYLWLRSRSKQTLEITADKSKQRKLLARMATEALRRPRAWREVPGLWHRRFIPCLGGKFVTLAGVLKLSIQDKLFLGTSHEALAVEGMRSGAVVLDGADKDFAGLFGILSNVRDIDELASLKPEKRAKGLCGALVSELDSLMQSASVGARCFLVSGLKERLWQDIDLSPIKPRKKSGWVRRFLAINPIHPWWQKITNLYAVSPKVALCLAVDRLAEESWLLRPRAAVLRRQVARRAMVAGK
ncbi:MAG: ATP-binding protein [Deltaproteobacteria bacterium]|nr:ATP-binding protein [Deltaproteobacteria bacterium]